MKTQINTYTLLVVVSLSVLSILQVQQCKAADPILEKSLSDYSIKVKENTILGPEHLIKRRSPEDDNEETDDDNEETEDDWIGETAEESEELEDDDQNHQHHMESHGADSHHHHGHHTTTAPNSIIPAERKENGESEDDMDSKDSNLPQGPPSRTSQPEGTDWHAIFGGGIVVVMVLIAIAIMMILNNYRKKIRDQIQYGP